MAARFISTLEAIALWAPPLLAAGAWASYPSPQGLNSGLTILMDNDLQGASSPKINSAVVLLDRRTSYDDAVAGCEALSETLWSPEDATTSIQANLDYLIYQAKATASSQFWVAAAEEGGARAISAAGHVSVAVDPGLALPALCTQSAPLASASNYDTSAAWRVSVHANNEDLVGFRDRTSFRFFGVRYAPQPERFTYPELYMGRGDNGAVDALAFGSDCAQGAFPTGSEDCLFLNIWTPYLPLDPTDDGLKPVMFWIHGGAFTSGTGADPTFDGGSLASRGDVVVVTINYRLATLGFLALPDGATNGNYGIADQVAALDWVRAHVAVFGGDAERLTVFGQSAGAASVRALMASPRAEGKFAGAIPQSNVGGLGGARAYSEYYTIAEAADVAGNAILAEANCSSSSSSSPVDCLRALAPAALLGLGTTAQSIVVDGTYITSDRLQLGDGVRRAPYSLLTGIMHDDGGALIAFPDTAANETAYYDEIGWAAPPAGLFPRAPTSTNNNATLDLYAQATWYTTDGAFRCVGQATVHAGLAHGVWDRVYYYEFERSYQLAGWPGYDTCEPPPAGPEFPHGDPRRPYFRCHSGELYLVFGTVAFNGRPWRDDNDDLAFAQFVLDAWAAFARARDPNPDPGFLAARGFSYYNTNTNSTAPTAEKWVPATRGDLTLRALTWPAPYQAGFREARQCDGLGLPLTYWE